jgi:signal transduction histidine kinase
MSLVQQFMIVTVVPALFLIQTLYFWRKSKNTPLLNRSWALTLLTLVITTTGLMSYFVGMQTPRYVVNTWRIVADYALAVSGLGLLITTGFLLSKARSVGWRRLILTGLPLLVALALDPFLWGYTISDTILTLRAGRFLWTHFSFWAIAWVVGWALPTAVAWWLTQQTARRLPQSYFRNQLHYWQLALTLFLVGGGLSLVHNPTQLAWQQVGNFLLLLASAVASLSLLRSPLPKLIGLLRHFAGRLFDVVTIFGGAGLGLWLWEQWRPLLTNRPLLHPIVVGVFAVLLFGALRLVRWLVLKYSRLGGEMPAFSLAEGEQFADSLLDPQELGNAFVQITQLNLGCDDPWLYQTEEAPAGQLVLRPLAHKGERPLQTIVLNATSPFAQTLRQKHEPIVQYDIDTLLAFANMDRHEKELLSRWHRTLYMPLHAGERLVGVLALNSKQNQEAYDENDTERLLQLSAYAGPILWRTLNIASLMQLQEHAFATTRQQTIASRHLRELTTLYHQFGDLISPQLRGQFATIDKQLEVVQTDTPQADLGQLRHAVNDFRHNIERLIAITGRLQAHGQLVLQPVRMDMLLHDTIRHLAPMSRGRQITVTTNIDAPLPPMQADEARLREALQNLLHNAIKFNRIGGAVKVRCGMNRTELFVHVTDTGVGMPANRLANIWDGFKTDDSDKIQTGLPLTRFIVRSHGGRVQAESQHGKGSTFSVYLPVILDET